MRPVNSFVTIGVDTSKPQQILAAMSELQRHLKTALAATPLPKLPTPGMVSRSDLYDFALALGATKNIAGKAFNFGVKNRMATLRQQDPPVPLKEIFAVRKVAKTKTYLMPVMFFTTTPEEYPPAQVRELLLAFFMAYGYEVPEWLKPT